MTGATGTYTDEQLFQKMIFWSVAAHILLVLFFAVKTFLVPEESLPMEAAIRVDIIDLPDKVQTLPTQSKANEPKSVPKEDLKKAERSKVKENALAKIKKMQKEEERRKKIEQIKKELQQSENDQHNAKQREARQALLKGNVISPGTSLTGLQRIEFDEYKGSVQAQIQEHWNLPEWLSRANLKATAVIFLDERGVVIKREIKRSSGDERFDALVIKTIDDASPLPPPPEKFRELFKVQGILLGFPQ
jgi:colicin import membrane protein